MTTALEALKKDRKKANEYFLMYKDEVENGIPGTTSHDDNKEKMQYWLGASLAYGNTVRLLESESEPVH